VAGLTPNAAVAVVRQYMQKEWAAEATWNTAAQNQLEVAPQGSVDDASWTYEKASNATPPSPSSNLPTLPTTVMVPRDATVFEALTNGTYMVFVKRGGAWMQIYSPGVEKGAPTLTPLTDAAGYTKLMTAVSASRLKFAPATMAAHLAADLAAAARGTVEGDPMFSTGPYMSQALQGLAAEHFSSATAAPAAYPVYGFLLKGTGEGAVVFFSVKLTDTTTAAPGSTVTISPTSPYRSFIKPGSYQSITNTELFNLAVLDPPAGSANPANIVGLSYGTIAISGQ
jgi:hypothetical protein